jgi:exodeoxyribonuclease VII small subunit
MRIFAAQICEHMKKTKAPSFHYDEAFNALQQILEQLESGKISLDEMPEQIERAQQLLQKCRTALRSSQASVDAFEQSLNNENN